MGEVKPDSKQCSKCNSICNLEQFETNRQGEWFKTCSNCRSYKRQINQTYRNNHRDLIHEKKSVKHVCECGGAYITNHKARHMKTVKHSTWLQQRSQTEITNQHFNKQ